MNIVPTSYMNGKHPKSTIFIIGTSDSLKDTKLKEIKSPSIGINHILRYYTPTYHILRDNVVLKDEIHRMRENNLPVFLHDRLVPKMKELKYEGIICPFSLKARGYFYVRDELDHSNNTGISAIEIAYRLLGCKGPGTIALLGIDLYYPEKDKKKQLEAKYGRKVESHVFGDGKKERCRPAFDLFLHRLPKMREFLRKRNISLVSCSPWDGPVKSLLGFKEIGEVQRGTDI